MNWLVTIGGILGGILGGGGVVAIVQAVAGRKQRKVDAADKLSEGSVDWALELKKDASGARAEAHEAREEAKGARQELAQVHRSMRELADEVEAVTQRLRHWRTAILDPAATLENLRRMVDADPRQMNGRH